MLNLCKILRMGLGVQALWIALLLDKIIHWQYYLGSFVGETEAIWDSMRHLIHFDI